MATDKKLAPNIDDSDQVNYPNGRIRDNSGSGDGTPVNRLVYGDIHEFFAKLVRLGEIAYNGLPDNEINGYQLIDAIVALAGKNDFITTLNLDAGVIKVALKLSILQLNEAIICKSTFNYAAEPQIKGTGAVMVNVTVPSSFKDGDYIRLIKTNTGISLIRLADGSNIDAIVAEYNYLKAATDSEEFAGASNSKATTPYTNQLAFARRVIGLDSYMFLASPTRNGLLSKEDKVIINNLTNPVKNVGWFSGVSPGGGVIGSLAPRSGDVVSAYLQVVAYATDNSSNTYLVTIANPMANLNYFVRCTIQSEGTLEADNDIAGFVFKVVSTNQFQWSITEKKDGPKSLKVHLEIVQIS